MDNEEDCGHVIRVGDPGRHRDADHVRCNLHQDLKDAGGNHMDIGHALITIAMIVNKAIP